MAPTGKGGGPAGNLLKKTAQKSKFLNKVNNDRIGQGKTQNVKDDPAKKDAGKELFADNFPESTPTVWEKGKGLDERGDRRPRDAPRTEVRPQKTVEDLDAVMDDYWSGQNNGTVNDVQQTAQNTTSTARERFSDLLSQNDLNSKPASDTARKDLIKAKPQSNQKGRDAARSKDALEKQLKPTSSSAWRRKFNTTAMKVKEIQDQIAKRVQALQFNFGQRRVIDIRGALTATWSPERLACIFEAEGKRRLKMWFSVGFYGATSSFTSNKVFNIQIDEFSEPR